MKKTNPTLLFSVFAAVLLILAAAFIFRPQPPRPLPGPAIVHPVQPLPTQKVMIYFNKNKGSEIVTEPVVRQLPATESETGQAKVAFVVKELLKGPTPHEREVGYFSEIPAGTRLLSVKTYPNKLEVDLSGQFTSGGGSNSMMQRVQQIAKTLVSAPQKKPVYLKVQGKSLEVLGGEGLMIQEPITSDPTVSQ